MEMAGKEWEIADVLKQVEKERQVMKDSGGGVTLCGGEPLMHPESLLEILRELGNRRFHRTVDTTLYASEKVVDAVMKESELFLIDLKHMDSAQHERFTGVPNTLILYNIRYVSEANHPFWIRIPLIVGVNDDDQNLEATAQFVASLPNPPEQVNLLVYHDIGIGKHARMGTEYNPEHIEMLPPSEEMQHHALEIFARYGINAQIGG